MSVWVCRRNNCNCDVFFFFSVPLFLGGSSQLQNGIKSQLEVVKTFQGRFWKDPFFSKIKIASAKLSFFMPFWNQNGISLTISRFDENTYIPFGLQKVLNFKNKIRNGEYGSWAFQNRSQNFLRCLNQFLRSGKYLIGF